MTEQRKKTYKDFTMKDIRTPTALTYAEISAVTGVSVDALAMRSFRGNKFKLGELLNIHLYIKHRLKQIKKLEKELTMVLL